MKIKAPADIIMMKNLLMSAARVYNYVEAMHTPQNEYCIIKKLNFWELRYLCCSYFYIL